MIYTKPITEISWNDIEEFSNEKIQENITLDYKKEFPSKLEKTISAFANTLGGIILIGVDEDKDNKPVLPITGVDFIKGLSEKVTSIILSNITPPIFPEIQICKNSDDSKAIIVIRVHQSNLTPHAINNNTNVYTRVANLSVPEELIKIDKLYWLIDGRKNSVLLGEKLLKQAHKRYRTYYKKEINNSIQNSELEDISKVCSLNLTLLPKYVNESYCEPPELLSMMNDLYVNDYIRTSDEFPIDRGRNNSILHQDGIHGGLFYQNYAYYYELNKYGLYYYKQHLYEKFPAVEGTPKYEIRFNEVIARIDQLFQSSKIFYNKIGYNGLLNFTFLIKGINDFKLRIYVEGDLKNTNAKYCKGEDTFLVASLVDRKKEIIFETIRQLAWSYNWDVKTEYFKHFEEKYQQAL